MGAIRIAVIATAAIAAILLAFVVRGMVAPAKTAPAAVAAAPAEKPMSEVLVAKRDLPVGARITATDLTWQAWPVEALNPNFITNGPAPTPEPKGAAKVAHKAAEATRDLVMAAPSLQAFEGAVVKEAMAQGEPIMARKVIRGGQTGYMSVVLQPGMRAMSVPINAETGVAGFVLPGDRVDVLQSRTGPDGKGFVTETLMRNLRVLAIDQNVEPAKDAKSIVGAVAVLEVPAADSLILARGKAQGEMQLALRAYTDISGPPGPGVDQRGVVGLQVYRGGQATEVVTR